MNDVSRNNYLQRSHFLKNYNIIRAIDSISSPVDKTAFINWYRFATHIEFILILLTCFNIYLYIVLANIFFFFF